MKTLLITSLFGLSVLASVNAFATQRDVYTDGAKTGQAYGYDYRSGTRDPYLDGAHINTPRDAFTDGARITNRDGFVATNTLPQVNTYLGDARAKFNVFTDGIIRLERGESIA